MIHACLSALAFLCLAAPAAAQDGFSILAPAPVEPETPPPADPVEAILAGPHLDRAAYLARRGETLEGARELIWRVSVFGPGGRRLETSERRLVIGDDYVVDYGPAQRLALDFRTHRRLEIDAVGALRNTGFTGFVHRRADVYARLSENGSRAAIPFGPGLTLERFWLEAAMGVSDAARPLEVETRDGVSRIYRDGEARPIFAYSESRAGGPRDADLFRRWMRHQLPIHPDALARFDPDAGVPMEFEYFIVSPDSPDGRREFWTLQSDAPLAGELIWPQDIPAAGPESYEAPQRLIAAGLAAASTPQDAPRMEDFLAAASAAEARGDLTGAYLALYRASHHFGPCDASPDLAACTEGARLGALGLGDPLFEGLVRALSEAAGDRRAAIDGLAVRAGTDDLPGAAASLVSAMALSTLRAGAEEDGLAEDPIDLFTASAEGDPYAPLTYWHAGRWLVSQGEFEAAWICFDLARSLPASDALTILSDARALEERLQILAPDFFAPAEAG